MRAKKDVVEVYIDVNQPYPDAVAASKLCGPKGACRYRLVSDHVTDQSLLTKVTPHCRELLGDEADNWKGCPLGSLP